METKLISRNVIFVIFMSFFLQSCSVYYALNSRGDVDVRKLHKGQSRDQVERIIGQPYNTQIQNNMYVSEYSYFTGDDKNWFRAIGHGLMDIASFGLWEIFASYLEKNIGYEEQIRVYYDASQRMIGYTVLKTREDTGLRLF